MRAYRSRWKCDRKRYTYNQQQPRKQHLNRVRQVLRGVQAPIQARHSRARDHDDLCSDDRGIDVRGSDVRGSDDFDGHDHGSHDDGGERFQYGNELDLLRAIGAQPYRVSGQDS